MTEIIIEIKCDGEIYVENPKFDPEPTWIAEIENEVTNERIRVEDTSYTRLENGCLISHWGYDKKTGCKQINEISMNVEQAIFISNAIQKMFCGETPEELAQGHTNPPVEVLEFNGTCRDNCQGTKISSLPGLPE